MKKIVSVLLVLCMLGSLLVGCSGKATKTEKKETKGNDIQSSGHEKNEELTLPLKEKITLTAFVHTRPNVDDFVDNEFTKWLEEQTNIHLEFIVAPENESEEKINLLFATGDYPDIILSMGITADQQAYYGSQGTFLPMNDLIEKYGENTKQMFDKYPIVKDMVTMPDGSVYNLPIVNNCYHCMGTQKMWVYKPWLEKLNLDIPQTTDEFYEMLKAFKEQDPNGNGLQDEVPLSAAIKGWEPNVESFIMNAFLYNATSQSGGESLYVDNGKVKASYTQDEWKEGLKYLQKLRKEGLLDKNSFTQDNEALKQLGENPGDMLLGAAPGGYMGNFTQIGGESGRWEEFVTIPPLEGPEGVRTTKYNPYFIAPGASITDKCEYPEEAMMLLDLMYSEEATFRNSIGRPDIEWAYVQGDALGLNGESALWEELIPFNEQESNISWNQLGPNLRSAEWRLGRKASEDQKLEVILYEETKKNYAPYYPSEDVPLPPLTMTEDQSATLLTYRTTINNYREEKTAYFILQDVDIDEEWDAYISELNAMGVHEMIAVYQEAYDAR